MATPAESATVVLPAPDGLQDIGATTAVMISAVLTPAQHLGVGRGLPLRCEVDNVFRLLLKAIRVPTPKLLGDVSV